MRAGSRQVSAGGGRSWWRVAFVALLAGLPGGCHTAPRDYTPTAARFYLEADGGTTLTLPQSGVRIAVAAKPVISEFDVVNVEIAQVELGRCLLFQLTPSAARDLYRLTASHQGRRLVLTLDGRAVGARRIDGPFGDGTVLIFVELPDDQLPALVRNLKLTSGELQRAAAKAS